MKIYFFRILRILRPFLQFLIYTLAIYIALTRISDYRHHPTDVITGIIVGNLFALLILFLTVELFRRPRSFFHTRYTILNDDIEHEVNKSMRHLWLYTINMTKIIHNINMPLTITPKIGATSKCSRRRIWCGWHGTKTIRGYYNKSNFYPRYVLSFEKINRK